MARGNGRALPGPPLALPRQAPVHLPWARLKCEKIQACKTGQLRHMRRKSATSSNCCFPRPTWLILSVLAWQAHCRTNILFSGRWSLPRSHPAASSRPPPPPQIGMHFDSVCWLSCAPNDTAGQGGRLKGRGERLMARRPAARERSNVTRKVGRNVPCSAQ